MQNDLRNIPATDLHEYLNKTEGASAFHYHSQMYKFSDRNETFHLMLTTGLQ